jgi:SAM-dependent methyltransferase
MKDGRTVRLEFDAIARAAAQRPDPPGLYEAFLLSLVPAHPGRALDIGCGTGRFSRQLAARASAVTAIDLSPEMIALARTRGAGATTDYQCGDALDLLPALGRFDLVVSLATYHHLVAGSIEVFKDAVAPGGILILHDLWRVDGIADRALDAVRLPWKLVRLLRIAAPLRHTPDERAAWKAHERHDVHLTKREMRALRDRFLPGAVLYEHFLWRYTIVWLNQR